MANQERGIGRGIFGISAPTREAPVPVLPKPEVKPTPPVSPDSGKRPTKKSLIQRLTQNLALRIALAGTALAGTGYAAYQEVPAVHRAVDNLIGADTFPSVPSIFDNTKDKGIIGENNIVRLPQKEIDQQFPTAFEKLGDGKNTLQLQYPLDLSESTDPDAPLEYTRSFSGLGSVEVTNRSEYERQGFYDSINFKNVSGGTIIKSPVDGYLVFARDETQIPTDPTLGKYMDAFIWFLAPNGNHYKLAITGSLTLRDGTGTAYTLNPLVDAPEFDPENKSLPIGSYGLAIKKGDLIAQVASPEGANQIEDLVFSIAGARQGEADKPFEHSQPYIPTNLELFTNPDGKIISPQR